VIKTRPTIPRLLVMIVFALSSFGALLYLWMAFGGPIPLRPVGYRFNVDVPQSAQLTRQADVRISGVSVGKVVALKAQRDDTTRVTIELRPKYAPIPKAARAMLRSKTLLGETYVELAPNRSAGTGPLPDNGTLAKGAVEPTVELDDVLRTFDPKTRAAFRTWQQSQAGATRGRGQDFSEALGELPQFADVLGQLAAVLDAQGSAVRQSVSSTADVFAAISARQGDLRRLITSGDRTFAAIGSRDRALAAIFRELPGFQREFAATMPEVTRLADRGLPVVKRLQPVATELTPSFEALNALSPDLRALMQRLGPVVTASQAGLPAANRILDGLPPVLDAVGPFTQNLNPILRQVGIGRRDLTAFLGNVTAATNATDASGPKYLRAGAALTPQGLAFQPRVFGQTRRNAYVAPGGAAKLATGLDVLDPTGCTNGDPAQPAGLAPLPSERLLTNVFRTPGRDVARPGCSAQGAFPGFSTLFPRVGADAPAATVPEDPR
jgi:virulence factor Mce-like protein